MAIAFDTATSQAITNDQTMPFTTGASATTIIIIAYTGNNAGDIITGISWNGQACTFIGKVGSTGTFAYYGYMYGIACTGSTTADIQTTGNVGTGVMFAESFSGAMFGSNFHSNLSDGSVQGSISDSITTAKSNSWVCGGGRQNSADGNSWTGLTNRVNNPGGTSSSMGDTNATVSIGSHSYTWGGANSSNWRILLTEVETFTGPDLPSVNDTVTVTDVPTIVIGDLIIPVNDTVTVADVVTDIQILGSNVFGDDVTVSDVPSLLILELFLPIADTLAIGEQFGSELTLFGFEPVEYRPQGTSV